MEKKRESLALFLSGLELETDAIEVVARCLVELAHERGLVAARYGHEAVIVVLADAAPLEMRSTPEAFRQLVLRVVDAISTGVDAGRLGLSWSTQPDDSWVVVEFQSNPTHRAGNPT